MDLIPKNYQEMISIPGNQDNELNKFFETIDNLNKPFKLNESKFGLNVRDENGNSILHRIIINSLNEQELLNKIQFIPNIETLINTVNFKHQSPLHLLCKYQYYQAYLLLKNILKGEEINYLKEEEIIKGFIGDSSSITTKKAKGIDIRYDILDSKNRLPLSYLVMGVDIDKIRVIDTLNIKHKLMDVNFNLNLNLNKMMVYFNEKKNCDDDTKNIEENNIKFDNSIDATYVENGIYHLVLNNKYVKRYINKSFIEDIYANTIDTVPYNRFTNINVDNMYTLNYFIKEDKKDKEEKDKEEEDKEEEDKEDKTIKSISTYDYYLVFSKYINNKLTALNSIFTELFENKELPENEKQKFINDNIQKIIETKTSLINKVFMDNQA